MTLQREKKYGPRHRMGVSGTHPSYHIFRERSSRTHRTGDQWAAEPIGTPRRQEKRPSLLKSNPDSPSRQELSLVPISTELLIGVDVNLLLLGVKYGSFMGDSDLCAV
jgi:hypothetical protein